MRTDTRAHTRARTRAHTHTRNNTITDIGCSGQGEPHLNYNYLLGSMKYRRLQRP